MLQVVLVWVAFLLLPCSEKKGAAAPPRVRRHRRNQILPVTAAGGAAPPPQSMAAAGAETDEPGDGTTRGGRLRNMLFLDTFAFLLIGAGAVAVWLAVGWSTEDHHVRQLLFWCRCARCAAATPRPRPGPLCATRHERVRPAACLGHPCKHCSPRKNES